MRVKILETPNAKSAASLRQSLDAFARFINPTEITFAGFTVDLLQEWAVNLLMGGYSAKTVTYYLKNLSALYGRAVAVGIAPVTDAFSKAIDSVADPEWVNFLSSLNPQTFDKLQSLVRLDTSANKAAQLAKDIILFSIYCGGLTFSEVAAYRKDDYKGSDPVVLKMIGRYATPKNKYLFPIDRHHRTPKQIAHTVELMFWHILSKVGLTLSPGPENTARDLWCATALRCGVPLTDILSVLSNFGRPVSPLAKANSLAIESGDANALSISAGGKGTLSISSDRVEQIQEIVIEALTDNCEHWFAMQLRPHVTPEMIFDRLASENLSLSRTFYPMEDIVRRIGKKKVVKTKPVISGLMFFRYRITDLSRLFSRIGDLAWGYRYSLDPRTPYAVITQREMDAYQRAIGMFTEDTDLQPVGTIPLNEGDRLVIIGGLFSGRPATLQKIETPKASQLPSKTNSIPTETSQFPSKTIYRLLLPGDNKCEWAVYSDPRLVRKITEQDYLRLTTPQP